MSEVETGSSRWLDAVVTPQQPIYLHPSFTPVAVMRVDQMCRTSKGILGANTSLPDKRCRVASLLEYKQQQRLTALREHVGK